MNIIDYIFSFFKKKVKKKEIVYETYNKTNLEVSTEFFEYQYMKEVNDKKEIMQPWLNFFKWYHSRPQSQTYTFLHDKGRDTVRRKDIRHFRNYLSEHKREKK